MSQNRSSLKGDDSPDPNAEEATRQTQVAPTWRTHLRGDEPLNRTIKAGESRSELRSFPANLPQVSIGYADTIGAFSDTVGSVDAQPSPSTPSRDYSIHSSPAVSSQHPASPQLNTARYDIIRTIGRGGMGVVYAAKQESLCREVALKMLGTSSSSQPETETRFISEALVTGDLDHPNIVPIYDLGRDEQGNLYMAMKLVRGCSWDKLLHPAQTRESNPGKTYKLRDHLEMLMKVCDAIAFAHARGIVHRDLKPENVMIGDFGEVLVMDWGVAIDVNQPPSVLPKAEVKSSASARAGTPLYMAPEVAQADLDKLGTTTDIYLLGGTLYEILTGTAPHAGQSVFEVIQHAAKGVIEEPAKRAPKRMIPKELARIAMKALAAEPELRYPTVQALQTALRDYLAHEESLQLAEEAQYLLDQLAEPGLVPIAERYSSYTQVLTRFAQATHLWKDNNDALNGEARAMAAYADEAIDRGDIGLAAAQLRTLEQNKRADTKRVTSLKAAVDRRSASRVRSVTAAIFLLVIAFSLGLSGMKWRTEMASREQVQRSERSTAAQIREGWSSVHRGDLANLNAILAKLPSSPSNPTTISTIDHLRWARELLLWHSERWDELYESTISYESSKPITGSIADLYDSAVLTNTPFHSQVELAHVRGLITPRYLWTIAYQESRSGAPNKVIQEMFHTLAKNLPLVHHPHALQRRALLLTSLWALAAEAADRQGQTEQSLRLEEHVLHYDLLESPFGHVLKTNQAKQPRLFLDQTQGWLAFDAERGHELWRVFEPESTRPSPVVIPIADGSFISLTKGEVVRRSYMNGRVLGRYYLDGEGVMISPDPAEPGKLLVLATTDIEQGTVHEIEISKEQPFLSRFHTNQELALSPLRDKARNLVMQYTATDLDLHWLSDQPLANVKPEDTRKLIDALKKELWTDPDNAGLLLVLFDFQHHWAPTEEQSTLDHLVKQAGQIPPHLAVLIGAHLEALGYLKPAQTFYHRALATYMASGGNPDLNILQKESPKYYLLQLGGQLFVDGKTKRSLELIEISREFSTYTDYDYIFYTSYARWLQQTKQLDKLPPIQRRVRESRKAIGTLWLSGEQVTSFALAIVFFYGIPPILILLLLRILIAPRKTQQAELYMRGFRTRLEQVTAYFSHPLERFRLTSWSFASRPQRLLVLLLSGMLMLSSTIIFNQNQTAQKIRALPPYLGQGYSGSEAFIQHLHTHLREQGPSRSVYRLLCEGYYTQKKLDKARDYCKRELEISQNLQDSIALNNLAVLDELQDKTAKARKQYEQAAAIGGPRSVVAQWNLARISNQIPKQKELEKELTHRDNVAVQFQNTTKPLWARASTHDLHTITLRSRSIVKEYLQSFVELARNNFISFYSLDHENAPTNITSQHRYQEIVGMLCGYGLVLLLLISLTWLPLGVRKIATTENQPRSLVPAVEITSAMSFRRLTKFWFNLPATLIPGLWDLMFGHATRGTLMALSVVIAFALRFVFLAPDFLKMQKIPPIFHAYFGGVTPTPNYPELIWIGYTASFVIVILYGVNLALSIQRMWKEWKFIKPIA
jgi:serine/threonine protein kinase